jgi:hypothetical protein
MSTASYLTPIRRVVMEPQQLRDDLLEMVADVLALRAMTRNDHFITHKAQRELLGKLNAQDLALVARALDAAEARQQPIYTKK